MEDTQVKSQGGNIGPFENDVVAWSGVSGWEEN
jgi:hypothetical protein